MTNLPVQLLEGGAAPERIVARAFPRKAAEEDATRNPARDGAVPVIAARRSDWPFRSVPAMVHQVFGDAAVLGGIVLDRSPCEMRRRRAWCS